MNKRAKKLKKYRIKFRRSVKVALDNISYVMFRELSICFKSVWWDHQERNIKSIKTNIKILLKALKTKIPPLQAVSSWTTLQGVYIKNIIYLELKQRKDHKSGRAKIKKKN